ncbi:hypothetical protein COD79_18830 [Bacillus cereus]|uniref:hypothetical protein n=1 Tax=Bacillus cereus TaxID=1396 RepID=UPI000BEB7F60|nr:hypothetical protein [Bacillus cereus]PED02719.1 hypothetical protein CON14_11645 [Bacillus cereus]PEQ81967.1 hypothetical protein CN482_21350 [Bacillus cereus]PEU09429.1 hypothetical protein CN531_16665 [Bacillus cereus]PEX30627.1 hypothetical protein CN459_19285 [Bacillus cereus]PEY14871.1 hypothetical protein CN342_24040 [Bacillus cereus]
MIKNIFSLLLAFVMITSCVVPLYIQPSKVHAASNQEQKNGIEYVNKRLGFSLIIPKTWEGNYTIKEEDGHVRFLFTYEGKINDAIPPLFTISLEDKKEEGWNEGIRWTGELGTKGNMGYYSYYDALHLYRDGTSPGEEQDTVSTMVTQVFDIFNTFKIIETNETEAKGATAGEAKPKEQGKNGGTAEEETNQETANGIKYINQDLGFELTVPKIWENHYAVEENDQGGVIFKFKFNGKVYDDIYLFNIYVANKEYSSEEQEELGDNGVLGIGNGKTYLVTENLAMNFYDNYDDYFSSVPKEGRNVIKAMSKQMGDIDFKVLGEKGVEEAKIKEEKPEGDRAEEIIESELYQENLGRHQKLYILKTPIENIKTEVIKERLSDTNYTGINGGFNWQNDYDNPTKINARNISYFIGDEEGYDYNYLKSDQRSWSTFITYYDKKLQQTRAKILDVRNMEEVKKHFKSHQEIINAIGGKGYKLEHWGTGNILSKSFYYFVAPARRTALGFKEEGDNIYAYLIISKYNLTVGNMEGMLEELGFDEKNSIMLDGSGSTSMQVYRNDKDLLIQDKGSEPFTNQVGNRHIYNMVRLIDTTIIINNLEDKDK